MPSEITSLRIRHYHPSDYPTLLEWWDDHACDAMDQSMIPRSSIVVCQKIGELVEPVAFACLFPCNNNHVAFVHGLTVRPGMGMADTIKVLKVLNDGLDFMAQCSGHTLLIASCEGERVTRGATMIGFEPVGDLVQTVARAVNLEQV